MYPEISVNIASRLVFTLVICYIFIALLPLGTHTLEKVTFASELKHLENTVYIYSNSTFEKVLFKSTPKTWRDVFLILSSVLKPLLAIDATLFEATITENRQVSFKRINVSPDFNLCGVYVLTPSSAEFDFIISVADVRKLKKKLSSMSGTCSPRSGTSSPVTSAKVTKTSQSRFQSSVTYRDSKCVITGKSHPIEACHIVPRRFHKYLSDLPQSIQTILLSFEDGIDSKRNGMSLSPTFHALFDAYEIAVKSVGSGYFMLNISTLDYQSFHLKKLDCEWDCITGPHEDLLDFHLQCCHAMHMRGAADVVDDDDEHEEKRKRYSKVFIPLRNACSYA